MGRREHVVCCEDENEPGLMERMLSRQRGSAVYRDGRPASLSAWGGERGVWSAGGSAKTPFSGLAVGFASGLVVGWQSRVLAGGGVS